MSTKINSRLDWKVVMKMKGSKKILVIAIQIMLVGIIIPSTCYGQYPDNYPPIADAGGPYVAYEGSMVIFNASNSYDPENDPLEYIWDIEDPNWVPSRIPISDPTANFTWYDDFYGIATVYVFDDHDNVDDDITFVTILNDNPVINSISGPIYPIEVNNFITVTASFTDPGKNDTHTSTFYWGDESNSQGFVCEENGSGTITANHNYSLPGVYIINLSVLDDDGGIDWAEFKYVVVYDPSNGFVTGGGWINSPEGAYTPDPTLAGKANFGFVSKYKKGQSKPSGNTEFNFKMASLNFRSDDYEWMLIAGAKAIYKGTGTINGAGNYGFMLSAIDEELTPSTDVDLFRIKIWNKDNGDALIYDNDIGNDNDVDPITQLGGGQIVIHKS